MIAPIPHQQPSLITRRSIIRGAAVSLIFAPAVVRAASLMPVRGLRLPVERQYAGFVERLYFRALDSDLRVGQMRTHLNGKIACASVWVVAGVRQAEKFFEGVGCKREHPGTRNCHCG